MTCRRALTSMGELLSAGRRIARLIGAAEPRVIRAYHGSPHSFSRFDASKIGTGVGLQTRGHGLYFSATDGYPASLRDGFHVLATPSSAEEVVSDYLARARGYGYEADDLYRQAADLLRRDRADPPTEFMQANPEMHYRAMELLSRGEGSILPPRAHMYEVEIGYPEQSLLNWGDSLLQQPEAVKAYAGRAGIGADGSLDGRWGGEDLWLRLSNRRGPREAAQELMDAGVPGITYMDREPGQPAGTRNYVMFPGTEDRIRILRQYGLLPPLVGAGMMEEE